VEVSIQRDNHQTFLPADVENLCRPRGLLQSAGYGGEGRLNAGVPIKQEFHRVCGRSKTLSSTKAAAKIDFSDTRGCGAGAIRDARESDASRVGRTDAAIVEPETGCYSFSSATYFTLFYQIWFSVWTVDQLRVLGTTLA
jgi:hypothetical protein